MSIAKAARQSAYSLQCIAEDAHLQQGACCRYRNCQCTLGIAAIKAACCGGTAGRSHSTRQKTREIRLRRGKRLDHIT